MRFYSLFARVAVPLAAFGLFLGGLFHAAGFSGGRF
jgi:hypothetical protein